MKRIVSSIIMLLVITLSFSQTSLNDYKYVIVPTKYDFLSEADKYQLNSLTKFLFKKYGFEAILEDEPFPQDLTSNRCLGLFSDVHKIKGLLKTKLEVTLRDCSNKEVFKSKVGETREKQYAKAYNIALRDAFESFNIGYKYEPNDKILAQSNVTQSVSNTVENNSKKEEIAALKKEIESLKKEKKAEVLEIVKEEKPVQQEVAEIRKEVKQIPTPKEASSNLLYAQPKGEGFQLVDSTPKVVMVLLKTPKKDVFLVKGQNAIVYQKDALWYVAKDNGGEVVVELLPVKF